MLCDKCNQHPANVHIERVVNGVKTVMNLCFLCAAKERAQMGGEISFDKMIKDFLGSIIGGFNDAAIGNISGLMNVSEERPNTDAAASVCPVCKVSFDEFREEGRLGCAECYTAFRPQMDAIVKNIHGSGEHVGKTPKKAPRHILLQRKAEDLRRKQREAIDNEDYETAAKLRDMIKSVESDICNHTDESGELL